MNLIRSEIDDKFLKICKIFNLNNDLKDVDDDHLFDTFIGFIQCALYCGAINMQEYKFIARSICSVLNISKFDYNKRFLMEV